MFYDYRKSSVPNTLSQIKKQIKKFKNKARRKRTSLYKKLNKKYRTIDWSKKLYPTTQIIDSIQDQNFKKWRRIKCDKQVALQKIGKKYYVQRQNLQGLCLLRQLCCQLEDTYLEKTVKNKKKPKLTKFYFDSVYLGRVFLFSYPKAKEWKGQLLTEFLKTKEFLFDEDSPYWKGMKKLKYFCHKYLMNVRVEKWESQVQRFLSEND